MTGVACVSRIYTDLAILDVTPVGLKVREIVADISFEALQKLSGVPLLKEHSRLSQQKEPSQQDD